MSARALAFRRSQMHEPEPLSALNITPLIDVLLVLIVTLILTIPMMTHKVPIDLPTGGKPTTESNVIHRIDLNAAGHISLDGAPVDLAGLRARLDAIRADPNVQLQFSTDGAARYERFDQTLAVIKRAGITKLGFVGNERFRNFDAVE
ncbi:MAG: biopolymer transporter ExbD [Candidatus Sphingomonas phytovorans]|nr:biopolymer transporter ExbD [Sphingomonas sp.]WEJ97825.1 MAG: biopolymer transporter ExbD [Sphingomonas sp.]